jgi:hypothetical protein
VWWCGDGQAQKKDSFDSFFGFGCSGLSFNAPVSPALEVMNTRILKIEAAGDFWRNKVSPKIRLSGRWLERAGFKPGHRVEIQISQPGTLMLRFVEQSNLASDEIRS